MPLYSFQCQKCHEEVEVLQGYYDKRPTKHKDCGGKLKQNFTVPSSYIGPQTVGSLAEKNSKGFSNDYKEHIIESTRTKTPKGKRSYDVPPPEKRFDREKMHRIVNAPKEKQEKYIRGDIDHI